MYCPNFLAVVSKKQEISQHVLFPNFHLIGFFILTTRGATKPWSLQLLSHGCAPAPRGWGVGRGCPLPHRGCGLGMGCASSPEKVFDFWAQKSEFLCILSATFCSWLTYFWSAWRLDFLASSRLGASQPSPPVDPPLTPACRLPDLNALPAVSCSSFSAAHTRRLESLK